MEQDCDIIKVEKEVNKKMQGSAAVGQLRLSLKLKPVWMLWFFFKREIAIIWQDLDFQLIFEIVKGFFWSLEAADAGMSSPDLKIDSGVC